MANPDLDSILEGLAFEAPVSVDDVLPVWNALRDNFPKASIEVYFHTGHPMDEVIIRVDNLVRKVTIL